MVYAYVVAWTSIFEFKFWAILCMDRSCNERGLNLEPKQQDIHLPECFDWELDNY